MNHSPNRAPEKSLNDVHASRTKVAQHGGFDRHAPRASLSADARAFVPGAPRIIGPNPRSLHRHNASFAQLPLLRERSMCISRPSFFRRILCRCRGGPRQPSSARGRTLTDAQRSRSGASMPCRKYRADSRAIHQFGRGHDTAGLTYSAGMILHGLRRRVQRLAAM